jgi:NAD(P)-dependent dehydrogenase (short-subunit alcohol dehydrogenase family)
MSGRRSNPACPSVEGYMRRPGFGYGCARTDGRSPWGGVIDTDMGEETFVARARSTGTNDVAAMRERARAAHPIGRLGQPLDIAKGIVFLASDDAAFMTGAGLVVDGGLTAQ